MPDLNLDTLSLSDLKQLQKDVAKAIITFEERKKADAREKVEAVAREMGFSLDELLGMPVNAKGGRKSVNEAKYRHPENRSLTWSGRGRKPKWFIDAVEGGAAHESLLIR